MPVSDDKHLGCRFCSFKTPKYRRLKDGRVRSGWGLLNHHIEYYHPVEYEKLIDWWDKHRTEQWVEGE